MMDGLKHRVEGLADFVWTGGSFKWEFSDWTGLLLIIIGIAFLYTVISAVNSGTSPLAVLQKIKDTLAVILRHKS